MLNSSFTGPGPKYNSVGALDVAQNRKVFASTSLKSPKVTNRTDVLPVREVADSENYTE
jgi:hypothetical protein